MSLPLKCSYSYWPSRLFGRVLRAAASALKVRSGRRFPYDSKLRRSTSAECGEGVCWSLPILCLVPKLSSPSIVMHLSFCEWLVCCVSFLKAKFEILVPAQQHCVTYGCALSFQCCVEPFPYLSQQRCTCCSMHGSKQHRTSNLCELH